MYEAVYAHPDGDSTAARFAVTADRDGYDGVIVRAVDAHPDHDRLRESLPTDLVDAAEVVAPDPQHASGAVGNARTERTVVCVRGGTDALNRFAVEQPRVDVLSKPFVGDGRGDHRRGGGSGDVDHVLAKAARDNGVHIEVNLGPALRGRGGSRVRHLKRLRRLHRIVDHYDTPYVVSATAESHLQLRAPRELAAVGEEIGLGEEWTRRGLDAWGDLVERNRTRLSESFIAPGVERGRYEEDDRGAR
ncbi:ribonuclease P [Halobellus salinus]|uniref:Ribonuclease P protein component 3 n=1 Tax=Halobellus salinus TaxID=931585 RepID=A0A830EPE7_9EURY|nr:RNase P subunit p30 family protein [Halobellus salinus]GGJ10856.1 ribonuclease P [Halobellus salinus]SMP10543.1 ribonuclease P protein subunit Rpp30 [Halobellus salinus]